MKILFWENTFKYCSKVLIPCEISIKTNKQAYILFLFHIPKFGKFWDVTDYHP
jgi:hypothetical protein